MSPAKTQVSVRIETDRVDDGAVEIRQSAEILFRELKVRGLSAVLGSAPGQVVMTLNEKSLSEGAVELTSQSLDRRALVKIEEAVDQTVEWIRVIKSV